MTTQMFKAKNMRSAIGLVNEEFGDNAIILSTKKNNGFVEIEASNNDEVIKSFPRNKDQKQIFKKLYLKKIENTKNSLRDISQKSNINQETPNQKNEPLQNVVENIFKELKVIKNELNEMYLTDDSSLCDSLSYTTPIRLRQQKFLPEIIKKLSFSYVGKNLDEGKIAFYRQLAKRLACTDFSRIFKSQNIFVFGLSGSGKSTLCAKLATFLSDRKKEKKINFIDVSNNSSNHSESLRNYSRVLGVPLIELKNFNFNNIENNCINIFDFCGDFHFAMQKISEIKSNFKDFDFCSILALQSGSNSNIIKSVMEKNKDIKPMVAITKLDESWVGAEELSSLAIGNARIGLVTGTKVLIDSIIPADENSLTKYMKENF